MHENLPNNACGDSITILHARGRRLAKRIQADGQVLAYDDATYFDLHDQAVGGLADLADLLERLAPCTDCCVIRGAIADPARTERVRRLLYARDGYQPTLVNVPRRWVAIDIDDVARPAEVSAADLRRCGEIAIATLPAPFHGAACIVQASGSHGFKPGCRLRLWFWLDRPTSGAELKAWLPNTDTSVFGAAQPIYSSAPSFDTGTVDPLPVRLLVVPGRSVVVVPPPEALIPPKPAPIHYIPPAGAGWIGRKVGWMLDDAAKAVASAADGQKRIVLLKEARKLGGVQHYGEFTEAQAVELLMAALPPSAKDLRLAKQTAIDGLALGRAAPIIIPGPAATPVVAGIEAMVAGMIAKRGARA